MISAINKHTGEVIELPAETLDEVMDSWKIAQEYEKAAKALKDQLKELVPQFIDTNTSEDRGGYQFRVSSIQRMTYDKSVLVNTIKDEDLLSDMLKPNKTFIDNWLKENSETSGEIGSILRHSMIADGEPYSVVRLEKTTR